LHNLTYSALRRRTHLRKTSASIPVPIASEADWEGSVLVGSCQWSSNLNIAKQHDARYDPNGPTEVPITELKKFFFVCLSVLIRNSPLLYKCHCKIHHGTSARAGNPNLKYVLFRYRKQYEIC